MNRCMLQYVAGRIVYGVYAIGARSVQGGGIPTPRGAEALPITDGASEE